MREATKAGLTNGVKDAIEFRRLLTFYPGGRVHVCGNRIAAEARHGKPSGWSLSRIAVKKGHGEHGRKNTAMQWDQTLEAHKENGAEYVAREQNGTFCACLKKTIEGGHEWRV